MGVRYIGSRNTWGISLGDAVGGDPSTYKGWSEERCVTKTQIGATEIDAPHLDKDS